ncbi:MAG: hypothetical protein ACE5G1_17025 [bacterium]
MGIQEIIAFAIVLIAAVFAGKRFIGQFKHGDGGEKCAKCELNKVMTEKKLRVPSKPE